MFCYTRPCSRVQHRRGIATLPQAGPECAAAGVSPLVPAALEHDSCDSESTDSESAADAPTVATGCEPPAPAAGSSAGWACGNGGGSHKPPGGGLWAPGIAYCAACIGCMLWHIRALHVHLRARRTAKSASIPRYGHWLEHALEACAAMREPLQRCRHHDSCIASVGA